jgi:transposase
MSRKKRFIGELSSVSRDELEHGFKYGSSPDFRQRCQILLLSEKGYEVKEISHIVGACDATVYKAFSNWAVDGLEGLKRKPGQGRKPILQLANAKHKRVLEKAVKKHGQHSDLILEEISSKLGITPMSRRSLRRVLKKVVTAGSGTENH